MIFSGLWFWGQERPICLNFSSCDDKVGFAQTSGFHSEDEMSFSQRQSPS